MCALQRTLKMAIPQVSQAICFSGSQFFSSVHFHSLCCSLSTLPVVLLSERLNWKMLSVFVPHLFLPSVVCHSVRETLLNHSVNKIITFSRLHSLLSSTLSCNQGVKCLSLAWRTIMCFVKTHPAYMSQYIQAVCSSCVNRIISGFSIASSPVLCTTLNSTPPRSSCTKMINGGPWILSSSKRHSFLPSRLLLLCPQVSLNPIHIFQHTHSNSKLDTICC